MHIVIIADPLDKQTAGIHYLTKHLVSNLLKFEPKNKYSIIRLKNDSNIKDHQTIALENSIPFIQNDPIRTFITLPMLIRKLKPDLVIETAHFGPFNLPKKIKRLTIIHDLSPIKFPHFHPFLSQILQRIFMPKILKKANLIITNSKNTTADVIQQSPNAQNKTVHFYLGKEEIFKPAGAGNILEKHNIQAPYFLNVGTIEPRKNLNTLLEAFNLFKQKSESELKLVITGGQGWKAKSFYQKLKNHPYRNDILQIGYVDRNDLPSLYSNALAFIYPSFYEGFGLPVLEAMACGAPCIVSNTSSLPEVGGDATLYFNPQKASEMAEKMILIHHNKAIQNSLKEIAIKQASKFSWEKYTKSFIQEIEERFGEDESQKPLKA